MSKFIYSPEGVEPKSWEFEPRKLMSPEAELIEKMTGWTFHEWGVAFDRGSILAVHALLFVYLRREDPSIEWDQVQFSLSEVEVDTGDDAAADAAPAGDEDPKA